jgi:DNA-binding NtrC family response regulator
MDDAPELLQQIRDCVALRAGGFEVEGVGAGEEALVCAAAARTQGRPYALVFAAPGPPPARQGLKTLARLREEHPTLEVIVCGGCFDSWEEDLALNPASREPCLFLKKPLEAGAVRQLVLFLAQKWSAARQARLDRQQSDSRLAAAEEASRLARKELESSSKSARGIAHDLNNQLTVISGHAGMLMAGPAVSDKAADSLKEITSAARRASTLIREFMAITPGPQGAAFQAGAPASREESVPPPAPLGAQEIMGRNETVLLVEDEAPLLKLMRHILQTHGYKVLDASTGKAALEIWQQHKTEIDVLLSDLMLPDDMGGQELAKILQAEKPGLKVIYTSGSDTQRLAGESQSVRGAVFIQKPFHARKLAETVFDCLKKK